MEITSQYAQEILDKTTRILKYNINIMDHMGVIVGSGDRNRINSFHEGAAEVIKTGKVMEITVDQAQQLEGAKPGVNLPIYLNEKIVGVVGITGDPNEVRPFGELLKISVETMLQQVLLAEQLRMEQNAQEIYIRDIIGGNFTEDEDLFLTKGSILGFDMTIPRVAVVIKIYGLNEKDFSGGAGIKNDVENRRIGLKLQKKRENILNLIKTTFDNKENMISYSASSTFTVFYAIKKNTPGEIKREITNSIENIRSKLTKYDLSCLTGLGLFHSGMAGLKKSYDEAVQVIQVGEKLRNTGSRIGSIVTAFDLGLEMVLANHSNNKLQGYLDLFLQNRESRGLFLNQPKLIETLKAFFKSDLNQSIAAQELNISRNTLSSGLDRVKELTKYNPRCFSDAVKLKLLILVNELL